MAHHRRALAVLALFLLAPSTQAAELSTDIPEVAVDPAGDPAPVVLTVTMTCDEYAQAGGGAQGLSVPVRGETAATGLLLSGPNSITVDGAGCLDAAAPTATGSGTFTVGATDNAPGLTALPITFTADIPNPTGTTNPVTLDINAMVAASFNIIVEIDPAMQESKKNQDTAFVLNITNFGNAPTQVHFVVLEGDETLVILPADIIVGSQARGQDNVASATLNVNSAEKLSEFTIGMELSAAEDPNQTGPTATVSFVDQRRGIPGFDIVLMPLALAGAALITARRRA